MADFTIENRQVKPAVYPIFQNENDTTVLKFTLDRYIYDDAVDLRNYKAYAVVSINGLIDMTELSSVYDDKTDTLTVEWNVQEYSLREAGAIQYQIVFKENADDGENTGVYYTYKAILMNRSSINADDHITANYPTLLKQWLDRIAQLSGDLNKGFVYIPYGTSIPPSERLENSMYWQWDNEDETEGHFEDYQGNALTFSQYKEKTKYLANQDLLGDMTNFADQHYITAGADIKNAPIANSYCLVKQYDTDSTNRFIQEVQIPDSNNVVRTFVRCVTGDKEHGIDKVGGWRELATTTELDAQIKTLSVNFEGKINSERSRAILAETANADAIIDLDSKVIHKDGEETINGAKTFSVSPKVPTAATTSNDTTTASTAFVKTTVTTAVNNAKSGVYDWTCLYSGSIDTGDIRLNQSFMNFDRMVVFSSSDGGGHIVNNDYSTFIFNKMMNGSVAGAGGANGVLLAMSGYGDGWVICNYSNGSTETFFKVLDEGIRIFSIYGYNIQKR